MIKFQDETQNLTKSTNFENFIFIQQWLIQNMWSTGATICILNKNLQKILFKKNFIWKSEIWLNNSHSFFKSNPIGSFVFTFT
jgi:hypothetical protein